MKLAGLSQEWFSPAEPLAPRQESVPPRTGVPDAGPMVAVGQLATRQPYYTIPGSAQLAVRVAEGTKRLWRWAMAARAAQVSSRRMRVLETVQFGEKRFVAMLEVDGARYLIGGASAQIALLGKLDTPADVQQGSAAESTPVCTGAVTGCDPGKGCA